MIRKSYRAHLLIFAVLMLLMSIPVAISTNIRGAVVSYLASFWTVLAPSSESMHSVALQQQQLENQLLKNEILRLKELFRHEKKLNSQLNLLANHPLMGTPLNEEELKEHHHFLRKQFQLNFKAISAKVIYRSPSSWCSSLWINVGSEDNENVKRPIVAKNSPVLIGNSVIGVVDYVGKNQCRVKLITDSGLTPSVRVARGGMQQAMYLNFFHSALDYFEGNHEAVSKALTTAEVKSLKKILESLAPPPSHYLAKGEIHGSSQPIWRSRGSLLKGIGFNYDFEDAYGPARDLRKGTPIGSQASKENSIPLLQVNDLLITTGMDGVFPEGLQVATVTKIEVLKEGDYYYELEAYPTAGNLNELQFVSVISPVGYNEDDQPLLIGQQ